MRPTIDLGIDLGTTNSVVAVLDGAVPKVLRNNDNLECTPSAIYLRDANHEPMVGQRAEVQSRHDPENTATRFKLLMGTAERYRFSRAGRALSPEQCSAEILKSLRLDAERATGEEFRSVVITVPASFEVPQRAATKEAARLAGFETAVLQQEPIAAGLAMKFQQLTHEQTWLVYDLGGGTFDAAVLRAHGGHLSVLEHGGDNHLGGEIITRQIVDSILAPALAREYRLEGLNAAAPKWRTVYAGLRAVAETAKIRLSRTMKELVTLESVKHPVSGDELFFEYELTRGQVDSIAAPLVAQTMRSCKNALAAAGLGRDDIAEIVLVGGPTLMPYLRETLEDRGEGLGIRIAPVTNPMTIVAEGAAIFAGTQLLPRRAVAVVEQGSVDMQLSCEPIGISERPVVEGTAALPESKRQEQWTIEFSRGGRVPWQSGRIRLSLDGHFRTRLFAEPGTRNEFDIILRNGLGTPVTTGTSKCVYTIGMVSDEQRLHHAIGVAMADNAVDQIIAKGAVWPASGRIVHELAFGMEQNGSRNLKIPVVEGADMWRADRNSCIGTIELSSAKFPEDLREGAKVEINLEVESSGEVKASAFLSEYGLNIRCRMKLKRGVPEQGKLETLVAQECARHQALVARSRENSDARAALRTGAVDDLVTQVVGSLEASKGVLEARLECENRLVNLRSALDRVEAKLELPSLEAEIDALRDRITNLLAEVEVADLTPWEDDLDERFARLDDEVNEALGAQALQQVRLLKRQLESLSSDAYWATDGAWYGCLKWLRSQRHRMNETPHVDGIIGAAMQAAQNGDADVLRDFCLDLFRCLPRTEGGGVEPAVDGLPGVTRKVSE
jgi:molecular chaperone DnaK